MGAQLALASSATEGIVSATGQTVSEESPGATLPDTIQASAAINPGNSGGALVDLAGQMGIPPWPRPTSSSAGRPRQRVRHLVEYRHAHRQAAGGQRPRD